ncbi:unnamed protein product [Heterobilharzia americana]|nr:unnamed protein product [Heterobilharzia americana]
MRRRLLSESQVDKEYFNSLIEQQKVDDITIGVFYRSRTLTVLAIIWSGLVYIAFSKSPTQPLPYNLYHAFIAVCVIFLLISVMIMPNGPFIRPHPAIWRIVFGASLLYFLCLVAVVFLRLDEARAVLIWVYPELKYMRHSDILDKEYAVNCSQISLARVYSHMDIFAVAHFFGWLVKAILLRHHIIAWTLSINWEITEVAFSHILPNFSECWWDSLILDVLVCNGLGIQCGMWLCRWLEMRNYKWDSIRNIPGARGKLKRAFLQFTPRSWTHTRWLHPDSSILRSFLLSQLILVWQLAELNSFFLKHIFIVKPGHILTQSRLLLITLISAPAIRQYYLYVIDPHIKRVGSQLWLFIAIVLTEGLVCLKLGSEIFEKTVLWNLIYWVVWMVFSSFLTVWIGRYLANGHYSIKYFRKSDRSHIDTISSIGDSQLNSEKTSCNDDGKKNTNIKSRQWRDIGRINHEGCFIEKRGWIVPPFDNNPWWTSIVALGPSLLAVILIFMDQQITAVIVNRREHKLKHLNSERREVSKFNKRIDWEAISRGRYSWKSQEYQDLCVQLNGTWIGSSCRPFYVPDVFFFSCILFMATFILAFTMKSMRNSPFFPNRILTTKLTYLPFNSVPPIYRQVVVTRD